MAHIINLGVQDVLKLLKVVHDDKDNVMFLDNDDTNLCDESSDNNSHIDSENELENESFADLDDLVDAESGEGKWVTIIFNIRETFKKIKRSVILLKKLESFCQVSDTKFLKAILDSKTRWDITFDMLSLGFKLKTALKLVWNNSSELKTFEISDSQWDSVVYIIKFLKNFKHVSKLLSS